MKENISDRGPLGALYRTWGDGKQMVKGDRLDYFGLAGHTNDELRSMGYVVWLPVQEKGSWLGEGDNHTFMNMLGNGLRSYEHGSYGGWGGRDTGSIESMNFLLPDTTAGAIVASLSKPNDPINQNSNGPGYPNFFPQAQRDFAARLKWSVTPKYSGANHEPKVTIEGPLHVLASAGEKIRLNGAVSDPDGDGIAIRWWQFAVGTYPGKVMILQPSAAQTQVLIPNDAAGEQTIHLILEATDNGTPALTRYQRVIITVRE